MKKYFCFAAFICCLFLYTGCSNEKIKEPNSSDNSQVVETNHKPSIKSEETMIGKIIKIDSDSIFVADTEDEHGLYQISASEFADETSNLSVGDIVEIGFDGLILEIYPGIIANVDYIMFLEKGEDFVGLYHDIFMDLYETDSGLNSDIDYIALDLTKDKNLTPSEKNALLYLLWCDMLIETRLATYDDLLAENLITINKNTGFSELENGMLLKLESTKAEDENFTFTAEKWRSSLGAYYFNNCDAKKENGKWTYSIGQEMIS
ncbi:hypothetical protein [Anaerotignum sp.]|uniref:hypothetical protein n=1 Tax=Anaerotignum sp. TaxID=2039241 RepID=UPI0027150ED2|nr:hypothetical protein [Anaerotignum sp.]